MQNITWEMAFATYFIYFVLSLGIGIIVYEIMKKPSFKTPNILLIFTLLTPDYLKANFLKFLIKNKQPNIQQNEAEKYEKLGNFIKLNNHINLIISIVLFIIACIFYDQKYWLLLGLVFWRFVSRSLEIIIAFVKDVISNSEKNSYLDKYDRIKLAITSYIEIIIYSAAFYLASGDNIDNFFQAFLLSLGTSTFTHVPFYTDKPKLFEAEWLYLLVYLQVITAISLVVLSIASYIGWNDKKAAASDQENTNPPEN